MPIAVRRLIALLSLAGAAWAAVLIPTAALAQIEVMPGESPLHCLQKPSGKPNYPEERLILKDGGIVRVRMLFTSPVDSPHVDVFFSTTSGNTDLEDSVLAYVRSYRLPCMKPSDAPVVTTQEFLFDPADGRKVTWNDPRLEPNEGSRQCTMNIGERLPDYPHSRFPFYTNGTDSGVVFALATFKPGIAEPEIEIAYDGGNRAFARTVHDYMARYRVKDCPAASPEGVTVFQSFKFSRDGAPRTLLQDATLASFLGVVDDLKGQHVRFDFTTMGCPFQVRFILREPYLSNSAGEVGTEDANRRDFLEWLKTVKFNLPRDLLQQVIGDSMTITVPCTILDLT